MATPVFMTSVYYMIPLRRICAAYDRDWQQKAQPITLPPYVQRSRTYCTFMPFPLHGMTHQFGYKAPSALKKGVMVERTVTLKAHLVKFSPDLKRFRPVTLLMIGASVDKLFSSGNGACFKKKDICTRDDILWLKRAFTQTDNEGLIAKDGPNSGTGFQTWLKELVAQIEHLRPREMTLKYSLTDLLVLDVPLFILWKKWLERVFAYFYYRDKGHDATQNYRAYDTRYFYGLLHNNDNYIREGVKEVEAALKGSLMNNISERLFASDGSIVFLHTQHPFRKKKGAKTSKQGFRRDLTDVNCIYEMCASIYALRYLQRLDIIRRNASSSTINSKVLHAMMLMRTNLWNLPELDKRARYIFDRMGVNNRYAEVHDLCTITTDNIQSVFNMRHALIALLIAALTLLATILPLILTQ